ncbi:MAG: NAD(P)-dependent glycerol-3-phosphate dehydrogenase [Bryobacteraceae bacterium]|nr:NAD(P)-dependent glycerol-3-phosphate dehydrogenase [Bryobacterales bacterium]MEB2363065.1 NAD(P)-dependent glycerol-3-phosphate dehydrogenase [Bryobacterales bacterium]NUM99603.1 NAD(P)-dependent glycerol-3-phosphate dehydrogenase [Bryobacteraceae bacterium]
MRNLAIIGGGSWGTALALVLAPRFRRLRLWVYEQDLAARMAETRINDVFLPDFRIPDGVEVSSDLSYALEEAEIVLGVMPSHHARRLYSQMAALVRTDAIFVSATKGLESQSLLRISEVIRQSVKGQQKRRIAVLSGPTFAVEVARGEPAAVVISSEEREAAETVQAAFSGPSFRLYTNTDPIGVEIGAALKNVIAIGAGICQGLGLGSNTRAALISRGLAEITRLATALGGNPRTLAGLAGLGDLVLTCTGDLSRNRRVGIELARGQTLSDIVSSMRMVAEGVQTTFAAVELARLHGVEMPIAQQMNAILRNGRPPKEAIRELMERSLKGE